MMRTINTLLTITNVIRFSSHEAIQKNLIDFGSIFIEQDQLQFLLFIKLFPRIRNERREAVEWKQNKAFIKKKLRIKQTNKNYFALLFSDDS